MGDSICSIIQQRHASLGIFPSSPANTVHYEPRIAQKRRMALFASLDMKGAATLFNHSFLRTYRQGLVIPQTMYVLGISWYAVYVTGTANGPAGNEPRRSKASSTSLGSQRL